MSNDTILFGKYCDTQYSLVELQTLANKLRLITTRQNYNQLCNGLRKFFLENGIFFCQNKDELDKHIPIVPAIISETSTINKGKNIDIDILLNIVPPNFFEQVEYFENLQNYTLNVEKLNNEDNSNAYVYKLKYNISHENFYNVVLKIPQDGTADNLVYEYLVGNCINEFSKFYPCFIKTYSIGKFISIGLHNELFRKIGMDNTNTLDKYIQLLDKYNIENMIITGCKSNQFLTLFTQYIPIKYSLKDYLKKCAYPPSGWDKWAIKNECIDELYELTTILHMIYQLLSSFADKFTHYDLHLENVILTEIPDNRFIHVIYHYPNGRVLHYNMCYIPVIIDYGHCFINCKQMNESKPNSIEIMKIVCNNDSKRNPKNPSCRHTCGNFSGYHYSTNLDEKDEFLLASADNNFKDYTRKNISHDCRLMHEILYYFNFSRLSKENFIVRNLVKGIFHNLADMYNRFGTYEETNDDLDDEDNLPNTINNVIKASDKLTEIIAQPEFVIHNDFLLGDKKLYGTLQIWTDLSRPFLFS
jgi:hypothetical protein